MNKTIKTIFLILLVSSIILITSIFNNLPWWSFVIPCIILGVIFPFKRYGLPSFLIGFIAGFLVWNFTHLYYDFALDIKIIDKISSILDYSKLTILIFSSLIAGVLSGLAVLTGDRMFLKTPFNNN